MQSGKPRDRGGAGVRWGRRAAVALSLGTAALPGCVELDAPVVPAASAAAPDRTAPIGAGQVETVARFGPGRQTEGIALDHDGTAYVSSTRLVDPAASTRVAEVLRVTPDGQVSTFATIGAVAGGSGALGVALDARGTLYLAVDSRPSPTHGVWRVGRDGSPQRLGGSDAMGQPNGLAFDRRGNLYATDSESGAIWRFPGGAGPGTVWVRHALLEPLPPGDPADPLPNAAVGANGIAFSPPRTLYVANTERGLVARIPILPDGSPGPVGRVAASLLLLTIDGIAVDVRGAIYAAIAGARLLPIPTHSILRIEPETAAITAVTTADDAFDFPTSLAFGTGRRDRASLFVANAALPRFREILGPADPKVVRVRVGVPGVADP